jgi:phosphotransferase system IIB component
VPAQIIKDNTRLVLIDSIEIDKPTVLRTDLIHEVVNPNNSYRLVLGMKYIGKQVEDILA